MPRQVLRVDGKFPNLNDIIGAARNSRFGSASMKKKWTRIFEKASRKQLGPIKYPVHLECVWIEGDRRRDLDNVSAAIKFVLDGMVEAGILVDDSQKWVKSISHTIQTSKDKSYGVVVAIDY